MNTNQYKKQYEAMRVVYEKRAYKIIKKHLKLIVKKLPLDNITVSNSNITVEANFNSKQIEKMYIELYRSIGMEHGKWTVRNLDSDTKDIGLTFFEIFFNNTINNLLINSIGSRITTVSETMIDEIVKIIKDAYKTEDLNIMQIRKMIYDKVNDNNFYRWQALRIARTETTTISNYATIQAGKASKLVLLKKWVSIQDKHTRKRPEDQFDHLHMNEVTVEFDDFFSVNGDAVLYAGDPDGEAGNIINCRCAVTLIPKRDANGRIIRKN